ncbi:hypothetical protein [Agrobacterium tumefaciens]|uniref:hypothetical protein n=1 Tax=Agrobacterium tumefaciens TaxID=358 RepID=UPI00046F0C3F
MQSEVLNVINDLKLDMTASSVDDVTIITRAQLEAIEAALSAAEPHPAPSVAVKALEWNPYRAETPFGWYQIEDQRSVPESELKGRPPFLLFGSRLDYSRHATLEEAKAAAQADYETRVRSALSAQVQDVAGFQQRVEAAHRALFHDDPTDVEERRARFWEEAGETVQAFGMTEEDAIQLVRYTWSRAKGEPAKEIGAAMLTLASLCVVAGYNLSECAETDLEKLQRPETVARIRAKRSTRHGRGPLPGFNPAAPAKQEG